MLPILSVSNQKGGVGKTTTATSLAHGLALSGRAVLVIDIDPQGNATSGMGLGVVPRTQAFTPGGLESGIAPTPWKDVWAVPAGQDLERLAVQGISSPGVLRDNLAALGEGRFQAVIIDCPPSLGPLTQNALAAATAVIVPIQCEYYPLEGLVQLLAAVRQSSKVNPALRVGGVLLTMYDSAADLSREVEAEVRGKLKDPVFNTVIPRDTAVAEAPSHCLSVIEYAPRSSGARGYVDLTQEVIDAGLVG